MMALVCLCMLTGVVTQNVRTQPPKPILMITKVVQTNVENYENVMIIPIEEEAMN